MKKIIFFVSLLLLASSAHADDRILGKWVDKKESYNHPEFEFKKNQDFIFTLTYADGSNSRQEGVWETGTWTAGERKCNLSIYVGEMQCCFEYKFIADNLILTSVHKSGYGDTCDNRVLVRETKEGE